MPTTILRITPHDHGRQMSLDEFEPAEVQEGYIYELGRGVIIASEVPEPRHFAQVIASRRQFSAYELLYPQRIYGIAGGSDCKILVPGLDSERHPDLAIYKTPPPKQKKVWSRWLPELVIEVVAADSKHRDYVEKRDEYLLAGVREYWIIDADRCEMLALQNNGGAWIEEIIRPPLIYQTALLPGFSFDCGLVFHVAEAAK